MLEHFQSPVNVRRSDLADKSRKIMTLLSAGDEIFPAIVGIGGVVGGLVGLIPELPNELVIL